MSIKIECICCRDCFSPEEIEYKTYRIPEFYDVEELQDFAEETGVEFDCPECSERV